MTVRKAAPGRAADADAEDRLTVRADLITGGAALTLVALASVVGAALYLVGRPVRASSAPFMAAWLPHVGPGTPLALVVAGLVVWHGPRLAGALGWRPLMAAGYGASVAWILSLALVDGWQRGLTGRLVTVDE